MPTCDECDREFDTDRGLSVHRSQMHPDTETTKDADESRDTTEKEVSAGNVTLKLSITHALLATFVVGVLFGGFFMAAVAGMGGMTGMFMDGPTAPTGGNGGSPSDGSQPTNDGSGGGNTDGAVDPSQISLDGEPTLGSSDAPVTVVMYEDFECPFCQRFEQNAGAQIVSNYVDSGQVQVVWKDFPLTQIHPWAAPAAEAMECVYRQDESVFWTVKDRVFETQNQFSTGNAQNLVKQYAADEGVSASAVQSCIDNDNPGQEVQEDTQEGRQLGVSGTPTVFINGQKIVGAQPFSAFQQVIENELGN